MSPIPVDDSDVVTSGAVSRAIIRLSRTHRALLALRLRPLGLRPEQAAIMIHLWESPRMRQTELGAEFRLDSASTTRAIQRLEAAGYVRRKPDPRDGRATLLEPTPAGLALRGTVEAVWQEMSAIATADLSPEETTQLLDLLARARASLSGELDRSLERAAAPGAPVETGTLTE